jgi:NAD(P)-dependent dehydrogenase (short-subunit alcohol dehydrogenase family)
LNAAYPGVIADLRNHFGFDSHSRYYQAIAQEPIGGDVIEHRSNSSERASAKDGLMHMSDSLAGRIALVTGGASGLGRAAAEAVAAAGAKVLVADINETGGRNVADAIAGSFVALDVADEAAWLELEAHIKREYGGLDVAVLAAGFCVPLTPVSQMSLSAWRKQMAVNLDGTMLGIRAAFRLMETRGGSVITVSSTSVAHSAPGIGAYAASKAGVRLLTRVAALEGAVLKPPVRVNCIMPGPMETPLLEWLLHATPLSPERMRELMVAGVPLQRLGQPHEFGALACFLASDASSFITGADVPLDGGVSAS